MPKTQAEISQDLLELLKKHEGYHPEPYDDGAGNATIGYGHRVTDGSWKQFDSDKDGKLDKQEAEALLRRDAAKHQKFRNKLKVDVSPEIETALGSLEYNLGSNHKSLKNIINSINEGKDAIEVSGLVMELTKARNKETGEVKELRGLVPRRQEEASLIESGLNPNKQEKQLPAQYTPKKQRGIFDRIKGELLSQAEAEEMGDIKKKQDKKEHPLKLPINRYLDEKDSFYSYKYMDAPKTYEELDQMIEFWTSRRDASLSGTYQELQKDQENWGQGLKTVASENETMQASRMLGILRKIKDGAYENQKYSGKAPERKDISPEPKAVFQKDNKSSIKKENKTSLLDRAIGELLPEANAEEMGNGFNWDQFEEVPQAQGAAPTVSDVSTVEGDTASAQSTMVSPPAEAELGFGDQVLMSLAQKPQSQLNYLKTMYGEDNVSIGEDGFYVNDNGQQKKVKTSLLSDALANSPEMLGGTVGGLIGAGAGFLVPLPGTTAVGAVVGRSLGSALVHAAKNWGLKEAGVITEADAEDFGAIVAKDMAINLVFDTVLRVPGVSKYLIGGAGLGAAYGAATAEEGKALEGAKEGALTGLALGGGAALAKSVPGATKAAIGSLKEGVRTVGAHGYVGALRVLAKDPQHVAQTLGTIPGTHKEDWAMTLRSKADAEAVKKYATIAEKHSIEKLQGTAKDTIDPISKKMVDVADDLLESAKVSAQRNYGYMNDAINSSDVVRNTDIPMDKAFSEFTQGIKDMGIRFEFSPDKNRWVVSRMVDQSGQTIQTVHDSGSLAAIETVLNQMQSIRARTSPVSENRKVLASILEEGSEKAYGIDPNVSVKQFATLVKHSDKAPPSSVFQMPNALKFQEVRGLKDAIYNFRSPEKAAGPNAISAPVDRLLDRLYRAVDDSTVTALKGKAVPDPVLGSWKDAGEWYATENARYSKFRELYDPFTLKSKLGSYDKSLDTLNKMLGSKGGSMEETFVDMLETSGLKNVGDKMTKLMRLKAGKALGTFELPSKGMGSAIKTATGYTPMDIMKVTTAQTIKKNTPARGAVKVGVEALMKGHEAIKNMSPADKLKLLSTPYGRMFFETIFQAPQQYQTFHDDLMSQVQP